MKTSPETGFHCRYKNTQSIIEQMNALMREKLKKNNLYLKASSPIPWQPCKLRRLRKPPHLLAKLFMTGP